MIFEQEVLRQPEVISTPRFPPPMDFDPEFDNFFNDLANTVSPPPPMSMSMQQAPQQPEIDSMQGGQQLQEVAPMSCFENQSRHVFQHDDVGMLVVIKQEQTTGFLESWFQHSQQPSSEDSMSTTTPDEHKRIESSLIKEELSCRLQLKMLQEGKDYSSEADSGPKDYPISEETRELQRVRREKNREAAKKCRHKKKVTERLHEQKLREAEKEVQEMRRQLEQEKQNYASLLTKFQTFQCFMAYLKHNRNALQSPILKSTLQAYARCQKSLGNTSNVKPCNCGPGCGIEQ